MHRFCYIQANGFNGRPAHETSTVKEKNGQQSFRPTTAEYLPDGNNSRRNKTVSVESATKSPVEGFDRNVTQGTTGHAGTPETDEYDRTKVPPKTALSRNGFSACRIDRSTIFVSITSVVYVLKFLHFC